MRYFVISDNTDTQVGLRLAGVEGVVARSKAEAEKAIDSVLADDTVGILKPRCHWPVHSGGHRRKTLRFMGNPHCGSYQSPI